MESKAPDTLERIQQAALDEFSEKGFLGASLRQIVKHAGVTTGAFYGYFSSKEALFASIVEPHAAILMSKYVDAHISFSELPAEEQPEHMGVESGAYIHWMVEYVCQHRIMPLTANAKAIQPYLETFCACVHSGAASIRSRAASQIQM